MRRLFALVLIQFMLSSPALAGDPVILFAEDNKQLNQAIIEARNSLPKFLLHVTKNKLADNQFGLKVAFQGDDYIEHIWISQPIDLGGGKFSGLLANEPDQLGKLSINDKVVFFEDQISDWNLVRGGKGYGFYTLRIMLAQMPAPQAAQLRDFLSLDPIPQRW